MYQNTKRYYAARPTVKAESRIHADPEAGKPHALRAARPMAGAAHRVRRQRIF
jgi:hypothetical protein